jgi:ferrous iron transport protein B
VYFTGILLAIGSSLLFSKVFFKKQEIPFVMELPPYRIPTLRSILKHMWFRAEQYIRKIAGVILVASIVIWVLGYFPRPPETSKQMLSESSITADEKSALEIEIKLRQQENSYIGQLGKTIEPVMRPLGFDWKMSVAILTGVAAKEVVVGTLGVLYLEETLESENSVSLISKLQAQTYTEGERAGQPVFNSIVAMSFMLFILIYFPCVGVLAAIKKESESWKWPAFVVIYTSTLAWLVAFGFYQIAQLFIA